ncbi:MAG: hypothetical protein OXM61_06170 [Candidatus Poribacteria bacterium]|nr:hypothetical protein [Candidatus Poribacteria bacterium]
MKRTHDVLIISTCLLTLLIGYDAISHGGRTDSTGCHNSASGRHCHSSKSGSSNSNNSNPIKPISPIIDTCDELVDKNSFAYQKMPWIMFGTSIITAYSHSITYKHNNDIFQKKFSDLEYLYTIGGTLVYGVGSYMEYTNCRTPLTRNIKAIGSGFVIGSLASFINRRYLTRKNMSYNVGLNSFSLNYRF